MNQLAIKDHITEVEHSKSLVKALLVTPHYAKMGEVGCFAVVSKAKSLGIDPIDALNGALYYVDGKVEMSVGTMNQLIRQAGHSITKDRKSDATICILHGKRKDTGDTWTESFSIDEAKAAGIYRNSWVKYPRDMVFNRALSRLARQLFPDVIKGCYVEGEIIPGAFEEKTPEGWKAIEADNEAPEEVVWVNPVITKGQHDILHACIGDNDQLRDNILTYMKAKWNLDNLEQMPIEIYEHALMRARKARES